MHHLLDPDDIETIEKVAIDALDDLEIMDIDNELVCEYECSTCGTVWIDPDPSLCDDECPACGTFATPNSPEIDEDDD